MDNRIMHKWNSGLERAYKQSILERDIFSFSLLGGEALVKSIHIMRKMSKGVKGTCTETVIIMGMEFG